MFKMGFFDELSMIDERQLKRDLKTHKKRRLGSLPLVFIKNDFPSSIKKVDDGIAVEACAIWAKGEDGKYCNIT